MRHSLHHRPGLPLTGLVLCLLGCGYSGPAEEPKDEKTSVVLDLVEQFGGANRLDGWSLESLAGASGARPEEGWMIEPEGSPTWFTARKTASIRFDIAAPRDSTLTLRGIEPRCGKGPQTVTVELNEQRIGTVELTRKRRRHRVAVPSEAIRPHDNRLVLRTAYGCPEDDRGARWDWIRLDPAGEAGALARVEEPETPRARLVLPRGAAISYLVDLPPASLLAWEGSSAGGAEPVPRLRLEMHRIDGGGKPFWSREIETASGAGSVSLAPARGLVQLTFAAPGSEVVVPSPRILAPGREGASPPAGEVPLVLVFLVDTLRADHLGAYGYERPVSPRIDDFARGSTLYRSPVAQSSWTRSAVASLFTGLEAPSHGVLGRRDALAEDGPRTLAAHLGDAGFHTVALVTNGNISPQFGMDRGFDRYHVLAEDTSTSWMHRRCDDVVSMADRQLQGWVTDTASEGLLLYVHVSDPHAPYDPPEPFRTRFAPDADPALATPDALRRLNREGAEIDDETVRQLVDLYDAEIAYVDRCFGRLVDRLRSLGVFEASLVAFTADHGEALGDHGQFGHGVSLYEEQTKVPLIVKYPGQSEGVTSDVPARHIDLVPTILTLTGAPVPSELPGRNLLAPAPPPGRLPTFSYLALDGRHQQSVLLGDLKTIRVGEPDGSRIGWEIYRLPDDPGETRDLSLDHPDHVRRAERLLRHLEDARVDSLETEIPPELEEKLRALGYL